MKRLYDDDDTMSMEIFHSMATTTFVSPPLLTTVPTSRAVKIEIGQMKGHHKDASSSFLLYQHKFIVKSVSFFFYLEVNKRVVLWC